MMKQLSIIAACSLALVSCTSSKKPNTEAGTTEPETIDTLATVTEVVQEPVKEIDIETIDDGYKDYGYTDKGYKIAFEVSGLVKEIKTTRYESADDGSDNEDIYNVEVANFDKRGNLRHYEMNYHEYVEEYTFNVERDGNFYYSGSTEFGATYNDWVKERVDSISYGLSEAGFATKERYIYNKDGQLSAIEYEIMDEEGITTDLLDVKVTKRDHHGNWTERYLGVNHFTRVITYYGE